MRTEVVVGRAERWFVQQGVPQLIEGYRFRTHVLPRMLPFLVATVVVCVTVGVLLTRTGPGAGVFAVAGVLVAGLLALPWLLARLGGRLPHIPVSGTTAVLIAYALTPVVVPLLLIGAYGQPDRALVIGPAGVSTPRMVL